MNAKRPYLRLVPKASASPATSIVVPPLFETRLARITTLVASEIREDIAKVRRAVEVAALDRGLASLERDLQTAMYTMAKREAAK